MIFCGSCSPCAPSCDNDGHFFLAEAPGPWQVSLTIVLEGTVSNGKQTCNFKLTLKTRNDSTGFFPLIVNGSSDQLGAMTGRLGNLPGVQVKSALTAAKPAQKEEN